MRIILIFILANFYLLSVCGKSSNDSVSVNTNIFSYYLGAKEKFFNFTYSITNLSNETLFLWLDDTSDNDDFIKKYFIRKRGESSLSQIAMEINASFECVLFESFVKKIIPGMCFKFELISTKEISGKDIAKLTILLKQLIRITNESTLIKEVMGFQEFNPHFFYQSSSLVLPFEKFYKRINGIQK